MQKAAFRAFSSFALPRLGLRASAFSRVSGQVEKRVRRRFRALGLESFEQYRAYLEEHEGEWSELAELCHITISRFFRDAEVFRALADSELPRLAGAARAAGRRKLRVWSAGCAAGEEPYSLSLLWQGELAARFPELELEVVATDADAGELERARRGLYRASSLREVPPELREHGFRADAADEFRVLEPIRAPVRFARQDLLREAPEGSFDAILCRNLAFSYFDDAAQAAALRTFVERLRPGGVLVVGKDETVPDVAELSLQSPCIYRRA